MMETADLETMPVPEYVYIPMAQSCASMLSEGDQVKLGQPIACAKSGSGMLIHASASGQIIRIAREQENAEKVITIKTDKKQQVWEGIKPPEIKTFEDFQRALRDSGMIGMEGACLATHTQMDKKNVEKDKVLIINGAEWTKYTDFEQALMKHDAADIIDGASLTMKCMGLRKCYIGVRKGACDAIRILKDCIEGKGLADVEVTALSRSCPPGPDRIVVYETTGKILQTGDLPGDLGIVVASLSSIAFLGAYARSGMPLVCRAVSVDGSAIKEPKNLMVSIGTKVSDIIAYCGGYEEEPKQLILGGRSMGKSISNDDLPLAKDNHAILAFKEKDIPVRSELSCENCGSCRSVCPARLQPELLCDAFEAKDIGELTALNLGKCAECGRCSLACPTAKPLADMIRQAKLLIH